MIVSNASFYRSAISLQAGKIHAQFNRLKSPDNAMMLIDCFRRIELLRVIAKEAVDFGNDPSDIELLNLLEASKMEMADYLAEHIVGQLLERKSLGRR